MKKLVIGLLIFLALLILVASSGSNDKKTTEPAASTTQQQGLNEPTNSNAAPAQKQEPVAPAVPKATIGERNALRQAENYLRTMAFSKTGLIKQLEFEGYNNSEAVYAVENVGADWYEQAAKKAKQYLDTMSFSKQGLIEQLKFEGFTQAQAEHGVAAVGY